MGYFPVFIAFGLAASGAFLIAELRAMKKMGDKKASYASRYAIPWKAVLYAPLANIPVIALLAYDGYRGVFHGITMVLLATVICTPVFYAGMLFWGIPVYLLLVRFNFLNIISICLAGAAIPAFLLRNDPPHLMFLGVSACIAVSAAAYFLRKA
ncbi:hypothetical protein SAMN05216319_2245 [Duganella sp. CF402]|uniref:hypothetical protein n=1 Tax=unclassified Duganella TaxID=2636909 RepID=UPI0008BBCE98|nr:MULTISPECIES: hypothetical protein [unclassified Duganella]RZT09330.1 hypothetical protein EV582_1375 [Duganella sp. BK701]SEL61461.1 hypothetical protein SAMN05216319_2245 [Duganella sp. CF402]